jgi:hypothetical protein
MKGSTAVMPMPPATRTRRSVRRTAAVELLGHGPSRRVSRDVWAARVLVRPVDLRT